MIDTIKYDQTSVNKERLPEKHASLKHEITLTQRFFVCYRCIKEILKTRFSMGSIISLSHNHSH